MKKFNWKPYVFWIALAEGVGALAGWLTRDGLDIYKQTVTQPPLSPPPFIFPIVWAILYALMGIGAARVYLTPASNARSRGLLLWLVQLAFNFLWSIVFFNLQAYAFAFFWLIALWLLILWMTISFYQVDKTAALLQIPYLLWVAFAGYLTFGVWMLNR
ncbi:MAG: tryptophan-rich sensory protein [Oscillospiraceae bacterium]|nr:tryptophan-rich sensory protein [Oscillospiraceae bacterium]